MITNQRDGKMEQKTSNIDTDFAKLIMRHKLTQPTWGEPVDGKSTLEVKMEYEGVYMCTQDGVKIKVKALVFEDGETLSL